MTILSGQLFNGAQTDRVANKNPKALPSAGVDKWRCHIKSGTRLDEVFPTLRHSVTLDGAAADLEVSQSQGKMLQQQRLPSLPDRSSLRAVFKAAL